MKKWFFIVFVFVFGCKPTDKVTTPTTPGGEIVVPEEEEGEIIPLTEAEFKQLQDDLRKQRSVSVP